jgi:hypothetical protein
MSKTTSVKIDGNDVQFGFIGRQFRLDCVGRLRELRHASFLQAIRSLPSDPVSAASQIGTAIDAHMSSVIIDDQDVNVWLTTPEGYYFTFKVSAKRGNPDLSDARVDELHDMLDVDAAGKLRDFWGGSLNGSYYEDVIQRVQKNTTNSVLRYYNMDGDTFAAFETFVQSGVLPGKVVDSPVEEIPVEVAPEVVVKEPEVVETA